MASCKRRGAIAAGGRRRSSAASTLAWIFAIQAVNSLVVGTGEIFQGVFLEHLYLLLGPREHSLAVLRKLQAALVRGERLFQGQLARLHGRHNLLQLGESGLEAFGLVGFCRLGGHREQQNSPWRKGGQIRAPGGELGGPAAVHPRPRAVPRISGAPREKGLESRAFYLPTYPGSP